MDNHLVVGVGNIYANESLFRAGIRPTTPANRAVDGRASRGCVDEVRATLTEAIAKGGSTLRDYVDSRGEPGYFQLDYFVYGREGQPCRVCGTAIRHRSGRAGARRSTARAASADAAATRFGRQPRIRHGKCLYRRARFACPRRRARARARIDAARPDRKAPMAHRAISPPASRPTATGAGACRAASPALHEWLRAAGSRRRAGRPQGPAAARAPAPGQADRRVRRRVLARQVRAHQRDLLRRLRRAPAAVVRRAHDDVPDRAPLRRVAPAVDPPAADRDAAEGRDGRRSSRTTPTSG